MKKRNITAITIIFILMLVSSCSSLPSLVKSAQGGIDQPINENSSGIYGYIDFGDKNGIFVNNSFANSRWLNLYFYPIDDNPDVDVSRGVSSIEEMILKVQSVNGLWLMDNKTFFISGKKLLPGNYGLLVICNQINNNSSESIWFNPANSIISIKEGELNYWDAIRVTFDKNHLNREAKTDSLTFISRKDIFKIMEDRLIENGWEAWVDREKQNL